MGHCGAMIQGMRWRPTDHDPRESSKHRHLLGNRGSLPYLPYALRWAFSIEVLSLVLIYGTVLGIFAGYLTALWIVILLGSGALAWLLAVVARVIWGFGDPPQVDTRQLISIGAGALRVVLIVVLMIVGYQFLGSHSPAVANGFAYTYGALFPSMLVLLATEGDLFKALNPARQLRVLVFGGALGWVLAVGSAWLVHRGLSSVAMVLDDINQLAAIQAAPPTGGRILYGIGGLWGAAFLLHWYGHALHHRHEAAGLGAVLEAATEDELAERSLEKSITQRLDAIQRIVTQHDPLALEQVCTRAPPDGIDALGFYHGVWQELLFHKQFPAAVRVAKVLLGEAVARKRYPLATEVWIEARRLSPSFDPGEALMNQFISMAEAHGDKAMVARLAGKTAQ